MSLKVKNTKNKSKVENLTPLKVSVRAMDLRDTQHPVICGHYANDTIAGAEMLVDQHIVNGELSQRQHLGIYAADIGSSTIVFVEKNLEQEKRGTGRGTLVVGLGDWDSITAQHISETIRKGVINYLFEYQQCHSPKALTSLKINSLLIGYNSTTHISIESSVDAVVTGIIKANQHYQSEVSEQCNVYIDELEFVEYFLDTAITAAHAVAALPERVNETSLDSAVTLEVAEELQFTGDIRNRLKVHANLGYWPRLVVTDASQDENNYCEKLLASLPQALSQEVSRILCERKSARNQDDDPELADHLKYLYLSERARAEAIEHQQQPGLLEKIIHTAIQKSTFDSDISQILYQLLLPLDFRGYISQTDALLLVLDGYTANFPWEMMLINNEPLVLKMAMVRQFVSTRFRFKPITNKQKQACVIGNPSSSNFYEYVADENSQNASFSSLASLPGATKEARVVHEQLLDAKYDVEALYPDTDEDAPVHSSVEVFNALFKKHYRILMIAAHGVVNVHMKKGHRQTGVVLSDGAMLTAAEIGQMEVVPQLVFLNCCHLAETDNNPADYNKLAYSLSRELIEMGVRCIIAAGWAVDDAAACVFSGTFFDCMLKQGKPFGEAVFLARKETYHQHPTLNTWGAYQAYGDPSFMLEGDVVQATHTEEWKPVAPHELLDRLAELRVTNKHGEGLSVAEADTFIEHYFQNTPSHWKTLPEVQTEIAKVYAELGQPGFEKARYYYQQIIIQEDKNGVVPMRAIEQLANLEARSGEKLGGVDGLALIDKAIKRIENLASCTFSSTNHITEAENYKNVERSAILGSAHKLKAAVLSRAKEKDWDKVSHSLINSCMAYKAAEFSYEEPVDNIYTLLNRIQFEALLAHSDHYEMDAAKIKDNIALAKRCKELTRIRFASSYNFFDAVMAADAKLAVMLSEEGLTTKKDKLALLSAYQESIKQLSASAREIASVTGHLRLLAGFLAVRDYKGDTLRARHLGALSLELEKAVV